MMDKSDYRINFFFLDDSGLVSSEGGDCGRKNSYPQKKVIIISSLHKTEIFVPSSNICRSSVY